jgi:hypothetical protein
MVTHLHQFQVNNQIETKVICISYITHYILDVLVGTGLYKHLYTFNVAFPCSLNQGSASALHLEYMRK